MEKGQSSSGVLGFLVSVCLVSEGQRAEVLPFGHDLLNCRAHSDMLLEKSNIWQNHLSEKAEEDVSELVKLYCRHNFENE